MPACLEAGSYALGLFFIFLVSCSWAGASVLIQYIYKDLAFDSPFIITYVCTSLFGIYLPWVYASSRLGCGHNPPLTDDVASTPLPTTEPPQDRRGAASDNMPLKLTTDEQEVSRPMCFRRTLSLHVLSRSFSAVAHDVLTLDAVPSCGVRRGA